VISSSPLRLGRGSGIGPSSCWSRQRRLGSSGSGRRQCSEAAKAQAEAAQRRRERKAKAREKRRAEEALRPRTPEADVGMRVSCSGGLGRELYDGDEKRLRSLLRALEAQASQRSNPHASIDDLD
jgi:hypothetical protein